MEDLKAPLKKSIRETKNVINAVIRGTRPHTEIPKRINPRRKATNPVVPFKKIVTIPTVPVDPGNKAVSKNGK